MLVRPIDTLLPRASRLFGAKAKNLAILVRAGFPVPAAYAVSSEAAGQIFAQALPPSLQPSQLFARPRVADSELLEARTRVREAELPAELGSELLRAFATLRSAGASSVALRCSTPIEDDSAGAASDLHSAVLNVRGEAALLDAVRECYAQVFSPRVVHYARSLGGDSAGALGLVLQALVPADVAGVVFTCNPLTGDPDEMVIDANYGLGVGVTDSQFRPDTYRVDKQSGWVRDRVIGDKRMRTTAAADSGVRDEPVPPDLAQKQVLDEHMLVQLLALGRRVEEYFGDGRAIEFAIAAYTIYVLQARPMSPKLGRAPKGRSPKARRRKRPTAHASTLVWSNLSVVEALPGVATPLTWSLLSEFSESGFEPAFASLGCRAPRDATVVGNFRGRVYLNLTELGQIAAQVPGLRPSMLLSFGGASELERVEREAAAPNPSQFLLRLPGTATRFVRSHLGFRGRLRDFEVAFEAERARVEGLDFRILSASALDDTLSDVHRLVNHCATMLLTAYGGLFSALVPLRVALFLLKGPQARRIQHALLSALEDVESAGPAREILRVASAFQRDEAARARLLSSPLPASPLDVPEGIARRAVERFLAMYGHRGVREAELAESRWREDPRVLFQVVRTQLSHTTLDLEATLDRRIESVRAQSDAARASIPLPLRPPLRVLLGIARESLRVRERLRSQLMHALGLFRLVALDASRRLAVREPDVGRDAAFFLSIAELHAVLRGDLRGVAGLVRLRRSQHLRDRSLPNPPETFMGFPPPLPFVTDSDCLQGLGASSGAVEGRVRVLRSADEAASVIPGEILVVNSADIGWSPIFVAAGGLVTDLGGPFSDACVVAREYGLPTVVNVRSATRTLKTGERVRLDGDTGTVQRLRP